ncbi:hypothetical protein [Actinoplanes sichuanensis]|uniref:Uncharacterized protein n=1 Tax=Actinoplanes sichuanensis TaxID=512349 RepID=A0ABW4AVE3_9ACTN|nr:hypothetical protein [Actinoplanes sichuanensis]
MRWLLAIGTVALIAVLASGLVWWGSPRMAEGSVTGPGAGMTWANDGVTDTRLVARGRPVATLTATFSLRNDGRLPFTVHGLDVSDTIAWFKKQQVTFVPGVSGFQDDTTRQTSVTLDPGQETTVLWSLDTACQPTMAENSYMTIDALRFRVSWWGLTTTRDLPLDRPLTFVGDDKPQPLPGAECAGN